MWIIFIVKKLLINYNESTKIKNFIMDKNNHQKNKTKPKLLSFFSGAMGLDIGLEKSGFETILACEIDKYCRQTILKNKPNIVLLEDIRNYSDKDIRKASGLRDNEDIDLIVGGPPCQAFSTAGKRQGFEDERGNVFLTFIDIALKLKPKYLVIENVRGLLSAPYKPQKPFKTGMGMPPKTPHNEKGGALYHILNILQNSGYSVSFELYNSANFGTPQKRERVIIICSRDGKKVPYLRPTHSENGEYNLPKWRTFKDAVENLNISNHTFIPFSEKRLQFYKLLKPGQYWKHLPEDIQKEAMGQSYYLGGGKTGFYRRLAWDQPAPTLVTHPAMPATSLGHPEENRPISIEEYKRVQEFPDDWHISGNTLQQYKQIGNAVPVSVGKAIGDLILKQMNHVSEENFIDFNYSRYKNTNEESWLENYLKITS